MDSGPSNVQSVNKTEPWAEQKPFLTYGMNIAKQQFNSNGPLYYPNSTVADFSPEQSAALTGIANRAASGSPLNAAAQGQALRTINGDYLDAGNPHLQAMISRTYDAMRPKFDAQFSNSGRYGSGAHQAALSDAVAGAAVPMAYQDYATERQNQLSQTNAAPALAGTDYTDLQALLQAGQMQTGQTQAQTTADVQKWNWEQQLAANKLAQYMQMVQGNYGGTSTTTQPVSSNPLAGILGLAGTLGSAALIGSDRRIKENIRQIGTAENGLPIYRFNYRGDPRTTVGVMAQDVEKVRPEVVHEIDGIKMVDYGALFPLDQTEVN